VAALETAADAGGAMAYTTSPVRVDAFDVASMVANSEIRDRHGIHGLRGMATPSHVRAT